MKLKKIITNWRVIILIVFLLFAIISIKPSPSVDGVIIKNVLTNSSAADAGIPAPDPKLPPLSKERITSFNGLPVKSISQYYSYLSGLSDNMTVRIGTNKKLLKIKINQMVYFSTFW